MEDENIVDLYWQRNENAIRETELKYGPYCMKISFNILGSLQESEENVNDTYLHAWQGIPPQRPKVLSAFLGKIARNLAINRYQAERADKRGGGQFALSLDELDSSIPDAMAMDEQLDAAALSQSINAFLRTQPRQQRQIFVRRYFYCDSVEEIAELFQITPSKVKSALFRCRNKLRFYLEKEGYRFEA